MSIATAATSKCLISMSMSATSTAGISPPFILPSPRKNKGKGKSISIRSQVGLKPESDSELESKMELVGFRIRLKSPLKVYHVPRVPEIELEAGSEGTIKQYVGLWKGIRISANLPFKVEFQIHVPQRGPIKLLAHLKDDEFDLIGR